MLTKNDIAQVKKALQRTFATKRDLLQLKDELREEINDLRTEFKTDMLQFKDDILFEIKAMREKLAIVTGYRDRIENHEERIEALEKTSSSLNHKHHAAFLKPDDRQD